MDFDSVHDEATMHPDTAGKNPGGFLTSALGVFVSAAIFARALGLPIAGIRAAAGIALSRAAGIAFAILTDDHRAL
jgi:hypothetical protein